MSILQQIIHDSIETLIAEFGDWRFPRAMPFLLFLAFIACPAEAAEYGSPDGAISAVVNARGQGDCEAEVHFSDGGRELLKVSYASADHEHGACVDSAAWTADSQFFVFNLYSSGGHQPWHEPIMFFARKVNRVLALENYLADPVTEVVFSLAAPNIVLCTTTKIPLDKNAPVRRSVPLGTLDLNKPQQGN